jgi:uncharacterized protein (DUF2384 family)
MNLAAHPMRPEDAVAFFNVGLKRDKLALTNRGKLLAKLAKQLETDPALVDIIAFAHEVLEREESVYHWLVHDHLLLKGKSPVEALLEGNSAHVRQLLANIEYGMPV